MNLLDFNSRFPDEASCRAYLRAKRETEGITCEKCGCTKCYWYEKQQFWECSKCTTRIGLKSGTLMEKSHIPLLTWFIVIHLMTSTKKAFSALEMQRQIGLKFYEPVWYMMQKIRLQMGKRDSRYQLRNFVEVDTAYYEVVTLYPTDRLGNKVKPTKILKGGSGSPKQAKVLVMVESTPKPEQTNPHRKNRVMGFCKMVVVEDLTVKSINYEIKKAIHPDTEIISDAHRSFYDIGKLVKLHTPMTIPSDEQHKKLPWVHTVIANSKRLFLGVNHSIGRNYLQNYLNEFCYKLNRRNFTSDLFDRMIVAGANDTWY